jgi:RNA polymerase sigma factor (sigma-70 family)
LLLTGLTLIQSFDDFYKNHYNDLKRDANDIFRNDGEDFIMDTYIKLRDRFARTGFQPKGYEDLNRCFYAYFYRTLKNLHRDSVRKKKTYFVDIDGFDVDIINNVLIDSIHNPEIHHIQLEIIMAHLFRYVAIRYGEKSSMLWKMYYLQPNASSYRKLSGITGYSRNYVRDVIVAIKQDIRTHFIAWLKSELNQRNLKAL